MMQKSSVLAVVRELLWESWDWLKSAGSTPGSNAVYQWGDWQRSYAKYVVPNPVRVRARIGETAEEICSRLPERLHSFLFHLDLSDTNRFVSDREQLEAELGRRGARVYNSRIHDIRSRTVQRLLREAGLPHVTAEPGGDPEQLLIVKSNYNYGARSERLLSRSQRERLGLTDLPRGITSKADYRVMKRRDVPEHVWSDPSLAVERYVSNREGRLHRFRICLDRWAISSCVREGFIKDFRGASAYREELVVRGGRQSSLPEKAMEQALLAAQCCGLDFGAMDAILDDDGECHIVDVNSTPGIAVKRGPRIGFMREAWAGRLDERRLA